MYLVGEDMTGGYGGADILKSCTVGVEKGEIAVIVGPNGAGKSTAMKAVWINSPETFGPTDSTETKRMSGATSCRAASTAATGCWPASKN